MSGYPPQPNLLPSLENGQAGLAGPTNRGWSFAGTSVTVVAQRAYLSRIYVPSTMLVTNLGVQVTTPAGSNDTVDLGIYTGDGTKYNLVVSTGPTAGHLNTASSPFVALATPQQLAAGVYYGAVMCPAVGTTAALLLAASMLVTGSSLWGTNPGVIDADFKSTVGSSLPATISSPVGGLSSVPIVQFGTQ